MVLGTNSENQQVNTSLPVRYEELKGSIHEELEQKRKLKFEPKVQVKDIPSTGKRRACKDARKFTKIEKQLRQANTGQKDLYFKLLKAFEGEDLVSAKELVREMKNLNISYRVQGVKLLLLLRLFVTNACKDAGWFEFYKDVLSEGGKIDLNADVCSSGTALSYACREKNKDVAELLLKHGTDINKVSALSGKTPILIALKNNDHNLASLLFRYGAKIDVTPELEQAIIADSYSEYEKETMGILLQHTSPEQNTEMLKHFSSNVTLESTEIVKLLLDKGADPNIGEPDAMQIATDKGNIELMNLFNQKLGRESKSLEDSFVIIPDNLTLNKIQDILDKAANENDDAKLTEVVNNIQDYESQVICNFDDPEEAGLFVGFSKKVLNLQSQVRDQYVLSRILMVLQSQENGSRYSVKELLLLAIAANDELTKKYHDMLFAKGNLNLLHLLVGGEKYIETFIGKFPDLYQSLKNQAIRLENGEVGFFSVIVLREEQELLDKVFANEDTLQNLKEILKNNTSDPTYGVLEAASLVQNEEFIKKVLDVFERDAKQNINDPATKTLLKESCITLLEAAISQECFPIVEYLCKKCIEDKNEAIQTIYKEAFTDDKIIETLKKQILKSIGTRGRREIYDLMLKTASSADNIIFLGKVLNLVKGNTKPFRESFATISENASPTTVEQLIDKQVGDLNKALSAHHGIKFSILNETFSYNAKHRVFVTDQGDELSKYFKEILYDQVKKAKEFSEELSKKNKDLKMEDLSLGCNSLDNTTGSNAQGDSSKAHSEVIVTESNSSDGENKKTVASSIRFQGHTSQDRKENLDITGQNALQLEQEEPSQQAKTDDLIQEKNQLGKEPNSAQKSLDGKIAELKDRKTFAKEEKNDTLNRMGSSIQNLISHNSREGKMPTNTEQQVKSSLGQEKSENTRNQLEKLQKELNEKTQALESMKTQLAEKEEELKGVQVQLEQEKTKLQDELKKKEKELNSKTREVTELTEEKSQLEKKRNSIQQDLVEKTKALNSTQAQLEKLQKDSDAKTKEFEGTKAQLERERDSVKQELDKTTEELKRKEADLKNGKKELDNVNEKVSKLEHETLNQQASIDDTNQALDTKTSEVTHLTEENTQLKDNLKTTTEENTELKNELKLKKPKNENNDLKTKLQESENKSKGLESRIEELQEQLASKDKEMDAANQALNARTQALERTQAQLEKLQQESVGKANEVTNLTEQLKNTKAQAEEEINKLNGQIDQLTQEKNQLDEQLDSVQKELGIRISEVTQLTAENTQLKDNLKTTTEKNTKLQSNFDAIKNTLKTTTEEDTKLQNDLEVTRKIVNEKDSQIGNLNSNIIELNEQLRNKDSHIEGLNDQLKSNDVRVKELNNKLKSKELNNTHGQLENKSKLENQIKELSCKNQKLSKASTHSKRQSNYASVSFVLSGVFAVGASLTMFHLVICISLAVAALTFLAVGFYCSYKANTALSNVEVKNGVDPIAVEV
ncbi:host RNA manipulator TomO [Wolbachia endosymbiont (group A) of Hylaeus communis]|uniref:host RNA manipulator TomO n=1 Tax=Wolbachia endosymbiont (group A) of Hylaeus communis TaxID=2954018 RepID=UPI00222E74E5|nr:ankyrin repeat domain-containing protein [Wolbachia endosymbiont (group A) of Hylaeus communis]